MHGSGKATHRETRLYNERLVLATLYEHGKLSRAEVARRTGLTRTTVSDVVAGLLRDGLAREVGRGPSTGGKAPILVEVADDARHLIGLDLGDRTFRGAVVDLRGTIVRTAEVPVDERPGDASLDAVFELVDRLVASTDRPILGVGIGTAGLIDTTDGTVLQAVNLDWRNLPLGALLRRRTRLPVYVANDSQSIALAEHLFGGRRTANLVVVKVGHGIGAGVVLDGHLFGGDGFGAGEIGHTTVRRDGVRCRCGRDGCLETIASSRGILESLATRAPGRFATLEGAIAAFHAGDTTVREIVLDAGRELGLALAWVVGALNVERIVLVGTVTGFGPDWLEAASAAMRDAALPLLVEGTTVEIGGLPEDAVVLGASALLATRELGLNLAGLSRRPALTLVAPEAIA